MKRLSYLLAAILLISLLVVVLSLRAREQSQPVLQASVVPQQAVATQPPATATLVPVTTPTEATEFVVIPPGSFQNPVLRNDFADPHIIQVSGVYYAYATNASGRNIQVASSTDLITWELQTDAMPALPTWARLGGSLVWAPEVIEIGGRFVLYYTARDKQSNKQCIGAAIADRPDAKFKDSNDKPLICQSNEGGSIDASPFRDGDKLYLYWKNDGNCCGFATYLYVQELAPDGTSLVGEPIQLVRNDRPWEGPLVEAPTMVKHDTNYYLFFSANNYRGLEYAVGYAVCKSAIGPCEDAPENPILKSSLQKPPVIGPGHQTLFQICDETWIIYHAWEISSSGLMSDRRFMWIDRLVWNDNKPQVLGPTAAPQPKPQMSCQTPPRNASH